jgi:hypothetical protein
MQINMYCISSKLNKKHHICKCDHFIQCKSFGEDKTPDDDRETYGRQKIEIENSCTEN